MNDSETLPSYWTVAFVLVWKDFTMLKSLGGQPIFNNIANSPPLLTRSKALVTLVKAIYKGKFYSLHFSWSCRTEKMMSMVERLDLNPHCDSGYTISANFCRRGRITCDLKNFLKPLPAIPSKGILLWLLQSYLAPLFLYRVIILVPYHSCLLAYYLFQLLTEISCRKGSKQDLH